MTHALAFGLDTFGDVTAGRGGDRTPTPQVIRDVVAEGVLADRHGLDFFGIGEHHRADFAVSSPEMALAAIASRTERIRLGSAVTVLSSDEPVRVFQRFATLDGLSNGRAEIIAGRGSFIESFPLFGQDLDDYDELYEENLELLLAVRASEKVTWRGGHRPAIVDRGVYPRPVQDPLPVWIGVGGNPASVVRAGTLGLPLAVAIIGGMPEQFAPLVELYRETGRRAGHDESVLRVATHSHGFVAETTQRAVEVNFPPTQVTMNAIGADRGWHHYGRTSYEAARSPRGALLVGSPQEVAEKVLRQRADLGIDRFMLHVSVGTMPHRDVLKAIELLGTEVAPLVRAEAAAHV